MQRYENVQELLNSIKEFTETPANEESGEVGDKSLGAYLQQITLLTDADQKDPNADTVKLMTIHAAKGLEFPVVFVGGLGRKAFSECHEHKYTGRTGRRTPLVLCGHHTGKRQIVSHLCQHALQIWSTCSKMIQAVLLMKFRWNLLIKHLPAAV